MSTMATMELIMERIRSKASQYKSFAESAKTVRMSQLEKRFPMDMADRHQLQKCLDTLQQSMKVNTLQGMVERLESISRQLNLKLMPGPTGLELFISSDMFYLELSLEPTGNVKDVKIHHEGKLEQQSCDELVKSLSKGDFEDFTTQLQGLISIYQLNAEKKVKCKAFSALCALEADLDAQWSLQSSIKNIQILLNKSPIGVLEKRKGGHPMRLTYFVSPYEVLESKKELSIDLIYKNKIGSSVTICLEGSAAHKLQIAPLVTINKNSNKSVIYAPMTSTNSTTLPAYFVLKLNKPQPICLELVKRINSIAELECCDTSNPHPLFSLITQHVSNGKMDSSLNKGLFVNLPDQAHCYFMTECRGLDGVMLSSIPFTHPSQVPPILALLRQQAVFNALVCSVIRPHSKQDFENVTMLEISALSCQHISVSFEHPLQESMSTIEIDLTDISALKAKLYSTTTESNSKTSTENISKILQRCLSIPVTMRYLIRTLQNQQMDVNLNAVNNGNFSSAPNGGFGNGTDHSPMDTSKIKQEPGLSNGMNGRSNSLRSQFDDFSSFSSSVLDNNLQKSTNLLNLVSEQQKQKKRKHEKHWKNTKQRSLDDCEILLESSSNDSVSTGTPMEIDLEPDFLGRDKDDSTELGEVDDVEEMLKATAGPARTDIKIKKSKEMKKSPSRNSLIMDLTDGKGLVPPSVTITPITSSTPNINSVLERRPGIEIIPLSGTSNLSSSITITPISSSVDKEERKNCKARNFDEKIREKKRKRKREEESGSKMGPPEKVPVKSDPLSKPVSVSIIKPSTDSPPNMSRPNSPSVRKYSASPTQFREKPAGSFQPSPKHSPAYGSSPKHSPKHGTSSPKQPSSSSGKPSMSTLKSASSSPNSLKNSEAKLKSSNSGMSAAGGTPNISKEQREKDSSRKSSGNSAGSSGSSGSPKIKSSSVKLKQLDISSDLGTAISGRSTPPNNSAAGDPKNLGNPLQRNRKGSLSAVIDKLKSAQEVSDPIAGTTKRDPSICGSSKDGKLPSGLSATTISKVSSLDGKALSIQKIPDGVKNPGEYMVKQSSDGMKLLINKKSKESTKTPKSSGSSGTGSPKTHTGLKPGVISGPASKKPMTSKSGSLGGVSSKLSTSITKTPSAVKSSLSKSLSSKGSGSPKISTSGATDLSRKENLGKSRSLKTNSEKGLFKEGMRKGSPAPSRDEDHDRAIKALKLESALPPSLVVEGLIKPFDTKFQIPKLSARNNSSSGGTGSGTAGASTSNPGVGSSTGGSNNGVAGSIAGSVNSNAGSSGGGAGGGGGATSLSTGGTEGPSVANTGGSISNLSIVSSGNAGGGTNNSSCSSSSSASSSSSSSTGINISNSLSESVSLIPVAGDSSESNAGAGGNGAPGLSKASSEKTTEKPEVKVVDLPTSKSSLDIAANLKYQTSKHDPDRLAKIPNANVPNLLSLPMALTNVSPKLPMTSPNLPTTSLSSITSKLDRGEEPTMTETALGEKLDVEATSTVDVASVKFQSASLTKSDELKKSADVPKHLMASQQPSEILIDFSTNVAAKMGGMSEKPDKTLVGTTPPCFIKPNSPAIFHKSPAHSPLNVPSQSPQSITDDELMDEALMLRK